MCAMQARLLRRVSFHPPLQSTISLSNLREEIIRHRDASQHACPTPEPTPPPKNEAARALLAKHFPNAGAASGKRPTTTTRKMPTDPKKLAQVQQVELMRMRHRAVPADPKDKPGSVGVDQRLHVKVSCRGGDHEEVEKIFWFRKVTFFLFFCFAPHRQIVHSLVLVLRAWALGGH